MLSDSTLEVMNYNNETEMQMIEIMQQMAYTQIRFYNGMVLN